MGRFTRHNPAPKVKGDYGAFRLYVRDDFQQCCAHCYLNEFWRGGEDSFEIDHFQPKAKHLFPKLKRVFSNLYWSCKRCNKRKGDQWPSETLLAQGICFVDLCQDTFEQHYRISPDGSLEPLTESASYTIDSLRLNCEHLIELRALLLSEGKLMDKKPPIPSGPIP